MWLREISILNFKNIEEARVEFCPGLNCLVGDNGQGKSNLLEAIYYLSMTRSFLRLPDAEVMRRGASSMLVRGDYELGSGRSDSVSIGFAPPRRKVLRRGGKEYRRMSVHIGTLPVVLVSPRDHFLVTGGPEERRRLMDTVISQGDPLYLEALISYEKAVASRNSLLRAECSDSLVLEAVEARMEQAASVIETARVDWTHTIAGPFRRYYSAIASVPEVPALDYAPARGDIPLRDALSRELRRDLALGYTTVGPHRDDLHMTLDGADLRRSGSQGQIKTFTVSLRLAIYEYLRSCRNVRPLLLLDDIFDKLDASRVGSIMTLVSESDRFGQIFITDTGRRRTDAILERISAPSRLFETRHGAYSLLKNARP